jgi:Cof subfamily protein (haloacid dehalogenase superfamily)
MKYKLIAIDMDGTLLNSQNQVSKRNMKALEEAKNKGVQVVLSTGRIFQSALYYSEILSLKNPIVACNGAVVIDELSKVLYEKSLCKESVLDIINLAEEKNIYYHFYDSDTFHAKNLNKEVMKYYETNKSDLSKQQISFKVLDNPIETIKNNDLKVYKFVFIDDNKDKLAEFRDSLNKIKGINVSSSWSNNIEVMGENVSKGEGLNQLCKMLNIKPEEVIAIGDNENDISMFNFAGLAVAMKNGDEIIRDHTNYTTDTNDNDGVAKVIEKFILK